MRKAWSSLLVVFLFGAVLLAAAAPVAVRVEVEPLRAVDDETLVAVVVQIAPEDRSRIGRNAMVRLELDGGTTEGVSPLWAVKVEGDGTARIEVPWPPGEHDLRVEIMSPSGQDSGLWVGRVRIPRIPPGGEGQLKGPPGKQTPLEEPPPPVEAVKTAPPATPGISTAGQAEAVTTPIPSPVAVAPTAEPEPVEVQEVAAPATPSPPTAETEPGLAPIVPAASETTPVPAPQPTAAEEAMQPMVAPVPTPTPLPVVEPLRGEEPPPPPAALETAAPPAVDLAAFEAWASADPETVDLTVVVTRAGDPIENPTPADLRLAVDGEAVAIEEVGDAGHAPLLLGIALDLSPARAGDFEAIRRYLTPLTARVGDGRGRLFGIATGGGETGGAGEDASALERALREGGAGNLTELVGSSLVPFRGHRGRTFLILITDGRGPETTKADWKEANEAAAGAGVPVLVMALWDSDFSQRTRKNLQQLAAVSGGRLFLVQGIDQLESVVERYGRVIDAGVALRFRPPAASKPGLRRISIEATEAGIEVEGAQTIRD